jgi:serine/threonine protein kinase
MGQILGSGGFATCFKAERKSDNKLFAVKVIRISEHKESSRQSYHHDKTKYSKHQAKCSTLEKASYEANFLKKCQHPNIVSYEADFLH